MSSRMLKRLRVCRRRFMINVKKWTVKRDMKVHRETMGRGQGVSVESQIVLLYTITITVCLASVTLDTVEMKLRTGHK